MILAVVTNLIFIINDGNWLRLLFALILGTIVIASSMAILKK
ncbi:hypothetical protein LACDD01_02187 [Lactococcus sp. DD01]|nr:hypothetical protein LACDD01_02187 [Lactococcus sp. DD01]